MYFASTETPCNKHFSPSGLRFPYVEIKRLRNKLNPSNAFQMIQRLCYINTDIEKHDMVNYHFT